MDESRSVQPGANADAGRIAARAALGRASASRLGRASQPWQRQPQAAVMALVNRSSTVEGLEALLRDAEGEVCAVAAVEAAWCLIVGTRPKLGARRAEQLRTALQILDRYADFGAGRRGAGVELAIEQLRFDAADVAARHIPPIHSLAFLVCRLRRIATDWRRSAKGKPAIPDTGQADRANRAERQLERWQREQAGERRGAQCRRREGRRR